MPFVLPLECMKDSMLSPCKVCLQQGQLATTALAPHQQHTKELCEILALSRNPHLHISLYYTAPPNIQNDISSCISVINERHIKHIFLDVWPSGCSTCATFSKHKSKLSDKKFKTHLRKNLLLQPSATHVQIYCY